MGELVFLKLGGSLITDKRRIETPRPAVIARLAKEIRAALEARPDLQLLLGHGSGSFGHFVAERYKIMEGPLEDWRGYAETAVSAQRLHRLVTDALVAEKVPVVPLQPSASARCHDGELVEMAVAPVTELLQRGLVPLLYGDVALDDVRGCTIISTEDIFAYLAKSLHPRRVIIAGEVAGVYSGDPNRDAIVRLIAEISSQSYGEVEQMLSSSFGVDVTGGMAAKVRSLMAMIQEQPQLTVRIVSGRRNQLVERVLVDDTLQEGTLLRF